MVDTESGYIRQDALPPEWKRHITHSADLLALGDANNNPLCVRHEVWLRILVLAECVAESNRVYCVT